MLGVWQRLFTSPGAQKQEKDRKRARYNLPSPISSGLPSPISSSQALPPRGSVVSPNIIPWSGVQAFKAWAMRGNSDSNSNIWVSYLFHIQHSAKHGPHQNFNQYQVFAQLFLLWILTVYFQLVLVLGVSLNGAPTKILVYFWLGYWMCD